MINNSLLNKLEQLVLRVEEINLLLTDIKIIADQKKFKQLSIEYKKLNPICNKFNSYQKIIAEIEDAKEMLLDADIEVRKMVKDEINSCEKKLNKLSIDLKRELLPKDELDNRNIILEIRAGTGGDEASIFVGDLFKMYSRYAERKKWQVEVISSNAIERGGFKEIIASVSGDNVYGKLKFESGAHRVQRIPETESQGRVHTSACTVAIMPEIENIAEVNIEMKDVRIDTFRASGAGGQHVNKTDSAVRVTYLPTNTVVECQDGRSQHKNKAQALAVLASRIFDANQQKIHKEQADKRKKLVGSGDRSERIRTYNYPQGRVSDHRINLTLYKLIEIMQGELDYIIEALIIEEQTKQLKALDNNAFI